MKKTNNILAVALFALLAIVSSAATPAATKLPDLSYTVKVSDQSAKPQPYKFGTNNVPLSAYDITNTSGVPLRFKRFWVNASNYIDDVTVENDSHTDVVYADSYNYYNDDFGIPTSLTLAAGETKTVFFRGNVGQAKPNELFVYAWMSFDSADVETAYNSLSWNTPQDVQGAYVFKNSSGGPRLTNVSQLRRVEDTGAIGFAISGSDPLLKSRVLIRVVGQGLTKVGIAKDQVPAQVAFKVLKGTDFVTGSNGFSQQSAADSASVGAFPLLAGDAAVEVDLVGGAYTIQVDKQVALAGLCLVEVYQL